VITFIPLTLVDQDAVRHVAIDQIVMIDGQEPASLKLATGEVLLIKEPFTRVEALIRSRVARDRRLLDRTMQTQDAAALQRAGAGQA
jgi:hypothetical protein